MRAGQAIVGGALGLLVASLAVTQVRLTNAQRQLTAASLAPAHQASVAAAAKVETVTVKLQAAAAKLDATIPRVKVETLMVAPVTHDDTTHAVQQFGALAIEHDRLQRDCSGFKLTCAEFRVSAHVSAL